MKRIFHLFPRFSASGAVFIAAAFIALTMLSCKEKSAVAPEEPKGTLQGMVLDAQSNVEISGATVLCDSIDTTTTNPIGMYYFSVPSGIRIVTISKDGYRTEIDSAEVLANSTTTLNFWLTPESSPSQMVLVQGGTFSMGSATGATNERPVHSVSLSSFYIGKCEVTQREWVEIMGGNPSYFLGNSLPVEKVSWIDAANFCNEKSTREGYTPVYTINGTDVSINWNANGYRLPTEAEWEFAARGGSISSGYKFSGSNDANNVAWYDSNSGNIPHDVGTKSPNELGIYDMSGNVWEWCSDWYEGRYYENSPGTNPKGPDTGTERVLRGGSWAAGPEDCGATVRGGYDPVVTTLSYIGFRLVRK